MIGKIRQDIIALGDEHSKKERDLSNYIIQLHINRYIERQRWKKLSPSILFRGIVEKIMYTGNYRFLDIIDQAKQFGISFREDIYSRYGATRGLYRGISVEINGELIDVKPNFPKIEYNGMEMQVRKPGIHDSARAALSGITTKISNNNILDISPLSG